MAFQIDGVEVTTVTLDGINVSEFQLDGVLVFPSGGPVISDFFSADIYTGNGTSLDIINDIDLLGSGGLVWCKLRDAQRIHMLLDTERGTGFRLSSDSTGAETADATVITSFNSDGFSVGVSTGSNQDLGLQVAWTFRKAPKFLDIIKYSGDGVAGREIPHSLGTQAGMVFVKNLSQVVSWAVQHVSRGGTKYLVLDGIELEVTSNIMWNNVTATDSVVTLGSSSSVNLGGNEYIAYVFAHDPSPEGFIQCGQYIGNGSLTGPIIELGWTPQFLLIKGAANGPNGSWYLWDAARGFIDGNNPSIEANFANPEVLNTYVIPTPTGFQLTTNQTVVNENGGEYIYMAVRSVPPLPPEPPFIDPALILSIDLWTGNGLDRSITTSITTVDVGSLVWIKARTTTQPHVLYDTERGATNYISSNTTAGELIQAEGLKAFNADGYSLGGHSTVNQTFDFVGWTFRKEPRFFDIVPYVGSGATPQLVPHNVETFGMVFTKDLTNNNAWGVYHRSFVSTNDYLTLNTTNAIAVLADAWTNTDDDNIGLNDNYGLNNQLGDNYIAYIFAHDPAPDGLIQCGQYTGNGLADGPEITLGWKPQYILIKLATGLTANWELMDTTRGLLPNIPTAMLRPNLDAAEAVDVSVENNDTGFKILSAGGNVNTSGSDYIYMAIREDIPGPQTIGEYKGDILNGATGIILSVTPPLGQRCLVTSLWASSNNPDMEIRMGGNVLATGVILDDSNGARDVNTVSIGLRAQVGDQPFILGGIDETFEVEKLTGSMSGVTNYCINFVTEE